MKVRIKLRFRGRQKAHTEFGFEVVNRFVKEAAPWGQADSPPKMLGDRDLNVILNPLPRNKRAKNPRQDEMPEPAGTAGGAAATGLGVRRLRPKSEHPEARSAYFAFGFTWSVDTTSRTPSVSMASRIALLMSSEEATAPDKVTTPAVVLTEMLSADRSRLATSLALMVGGGAGVGGGIGNRVTGLRCRAADHLAGAGQLIFDVLGAEVEHAQFVRGGIAGRLGGGLDLFPGGLQPGIISVVAVEPNRRATKSDAQD